MPPFNMVNNHIHSIWGSVFKFSHVGQSSWKAQKRQPGDAPMVDKKFAARHSNVFSIVETKKIVKNGRCTQAYSCTHRPNELKVC